MTSLRRPLCTLSLVLSFASACSSGGGADAGPPPSAGAYFNLVAGQCLLYTRNDGGSPVVAVDIQPVVNPPGVKLVRSRSGGATEHVDYLVLDGGSVLLDKTDDVGTNGLTSVAFLPPYVPFLQAPLDQTPMLSANMVPTMISANGGTINFNTTSNASWAETNTQAWTGFAPAAAGDGGLTETEITLVITPGDAGAQESRNWVTPGVGFTDLYLSEANGTQNHYLLANITSDSPICAAP